MRKDQLSYGTDYVIKHVESYGSGITYTDYCIMASKAKKNLKIRLRAERLFLLKRVKGR